MRFRCLLLLICWCVHHVSAQQQAHDPVVLVIHGGAGTIRPDQLSPRMRDSLHTALTAALQAGYAQLQAHHSAIDAVQAAIHIMENSPLFNAGKGAVYTQAGTHEMDAAIMDGATLRAGAVAAVSHIKNPIDAAIAVMRQSPHVLLVGKGAEDFAAAHGVELAPASYFDTPERKRQWERYRQHRTSEIFQPGKQARPIADQAYYDLHEWGTVGAVALDDSGHLAAGTSTGGIMGKLPGRVGDSPIIGAGTYANDTTCAVSCTGTGEYFMRALAAKTLSDLIAYRHMSLQQAAHTVIFDIIQRMGGDGGLIALNTKGEFAMPFNTSGMYRGYITRSGKIYIAFFQDEHP
ncbi:MAG: isoaspartyl peptidase/L-asparaginase [Thermoflavifilum sp.]|nr:isoaspartyl peptidase/L-asparaginase [Thermoflavifilum sp.]